MPEWLISRAIEGARGIKVPFDQLIQSAISEYMMKHCEEDFIVLSYGRKYKISTGRIIPGEVTSPGSSSPLPPMKTGARRSAKAPKESSPFSQAEVDKGIAYLDLTV